jgi:hypothetical protein
LGEAFAFERRGEIEIKGVGREETWFLMREAGRDPGLRNREPKG